MWDFVNIISSNEYEKVVDDLSKFSGARWFTGAKLNFAENLLKFRDDNLALVFNGEDQKSSCLTYLDLYNQVAQLAKSLTEIGVVSGDRVAAYMPNLMETVVAMLATTSVGATWASCGAELGPAALLDRLAQIEPKVLFTADGYFYKGPIQRYIMG